MPAAGRISFQVAICTAGTASSSRAGTAAACATNACAGEPVMPARSAASATSSAESGRTIPGGTGIAMSYWA